MPSFKIVISDTSCLMVLGKHNAFDLLRQLFSQVLITPNVEQEYGEGLPEWIVIRTPKDSAMVERLRKSVDPGEASAIALAIEIGDATLLLDDRQARLLAEQMSLSYMGALGLLLKAKKQGAIPAIKPYTDQMLQTNFRISPALIAYALEQAGEFNSPAISKNDPQPCAAIFSGRPPAWRCLF